MAQDIVTYIREQTRAGYDINSIKVALQRAGYSPAAIDSAVRQAYAQQQPSVVKHVIHFSPTTMIAIAVVFLLIAGGGLLFYKSMNKQPSQLLDLQVTVSDIEVSQGDNLEFNIELINMGSEGRYDITLRYLVMDSAEKIVKTKEETVALDTRVSKNAEVSIPSTTAPGIYKLRVLAKYDTKVANAEETFSVVKSEAPATQPQQPSQPSQPSTPSTTPTDCNDNNACTIDFPSDTGCSHTPLSPCCGNNNCEMGESYLNCPKDCTEPTLPTSAPSQTITIWDQLAGIEETARKNPSKAADECNEITDRVFKDDCHSRVAETARDEEFCNNIQDERTKDNCIRAVAKVIRDVELCARIIRDAIRDQCYMSFVSESNYAICDKLSNEFLRENCNQLKKLSEFQS